MKICPGSGVSCEFAPECPTGTCTKDEHAAFVAEMAKPAARMLDEIDATLVEATRLALLAVEALKDARHRPTEYPRPSVRAATYLRCAAEILGDLSR